MKLIKSDTTIKQNPELITSEVDGERVMMDMKTGEYFGLDSIGTRIWDLIESPTKIAEIVEILINEFDVSKEQCELDTIDFIRELVDKNLVFIVSE